jgi:hypothetical protein
VEMWDNKGRSALKAGNMLPSRTSWRVVWVSPMCCWKDFRDLPTPQMCRGYLQKLGTATNSHSKKIIISARLALNPTCNTNDKAIRGQFPLQRNSP